MDGGPFLVYFLPILDGQKAAVSDSVEGWCAAGNLGASRVSIRMDDQTDGQMDDEMDDGRIKGKLHFIPTSFNICNCLPKVLPAHLHSWTKGRNMTF
jgi:hypothetical protein